MFVRLTRTKRLRAGWLFALTYLLCVAALSASFAIGKNVSHCLTANSFGLSAMQLHKAAGAEHGHGDGGTLDHYGMHNVAEKETFSPAIPSARHQTIPVGLQNMNRLASWSDAMIA